MTPLQSVRKNINNYYWDFRPGRSLNHFPPISVTVYFTHRHIYNCGSPLQTAVTEGGGGEGRMTWWRRELNPQPADRRKRDQLPSPLGHPGPWLVAKTNPAKFQYNRLISAASSPLSLIMFGIEISIALQLEKRNVTPYIERL